MTSQEKQLESYLHKHIPISLAMGIAVESACKEKVTLKAPFVNNINHKQTVFGGSLHAVATLACWGLLHVNLESFKQVQIVIAKSEVEYLAPVIGDFKATCSLPEKNDWEQFIKMLEKKGRGRINLIAEIVQHGKLCVYYRGVFAAISKE